jgi:hypothetical protein
MNLLPWLPTYLPGHILESTVYLNSDEIGTSTQRQSSARSRAGSDAVAKFQQVYTRDVGLSR